jgi:hypothetical protein
LDKNALKAAAVLALVIAAIAGYFFWPDKQSNSDVSTAVPMSANTLAPKQSAPVQQVLEAPTVQSPTPQLTDSDSFVMAGLAKLISNKSLMKLFHTEKIIRNIVATIDSLPRMKLPLKILPLEQPAGKFMICPSARRMPIDIPSMFNWPRPSTQKNCLICMYVSIHCFNRPTRNLVIPTNILMTDW